MEVIPADLEASLRAFNRDLLFWLKRGGDDRIVEFDPLDSWRDVVKLLTLYTVPAVGGEQ